MRRAAFTIVERESTPDVLVIRDEDNGNVSVTNDAENVVKRLYAEGLLTASRALHYYDSDGNKDGLRHKDGQFTGFYFLPRN